MDTLQYENFIINKDKNRVYSLMHNYYAFVMILYNYVSNTVSIANYFVMTLDK